MKHWRELFERETYRREIIEQDVRLFSPLDPITLATRLKDEMILSKKRTGRQVYGFGSEKKMNLVYAKRKGSRDFAAQLAATMGEYQGGTLITGNTRQILKDIPFVILWCAFTGTFFMGSLVFWFIDFDWLGRLMFSGIPALMFIMVLALEWGRPARKPPKDIGSAQDIIDWLAKTIDAHPVEQGPEAQDP